MAARARGPDLPLAHSPTAARRYDPRFDVDANVDLDDLRSDRSFDALDNLLEHYSVDLIPRDVKFKFRKKCGPPLPQQQSLPEHLPSSFLCAHTVHAHASQFRYNFFPTAIAPLMPGSIYACSTGNFMSVGATVSSPFRLSPMPLRIPRVSLMVRMTVQIAIRTEGGGRG